MNNSDQTSIENTNTTDKIRVAIAEDQQLVRAGLSMVINSRPDMEVTLEASDGAQLLRLLRSYPADIVLMDVRMPNLDGLSATTEIIAHPEIYKSMPKIILLTTYDLDDYVLRAIEIGASGFLLKNTEPEQILSYIRSVHAGEAVLSPSTTKRFMDKLASMISSTPVPVDPEIFSDLTSREKDVLKLLAEGCNNQEIAQKLFLSDSTVKTHIAHILDKLQVRDRLQAVVITYQSGFFDSLSNK